METFFLKSAHGSKQIKVVFLPVRWPIDDFSLTSRSRKKVFKVREVLLADIVRNHHQCQKTFFVARANTEFALFAHLTFFLNTKTFRPYYDGEAEVVSSSTLPLCNLFSRWHKWPRGWHPLFLISSEFLLALSDKKKFHSLWFTTRDVETQWAKKLG